MNVSATDPHDTAQDDDDEPVTFTRRQLRAIIDHQLIHHQWLEAFAAELERLYLYRQPGTWPMTQRAKREHYRRSHPDVTLPDIPL